MSDNYLYHYTSIKTLEEILKSKKLQFSSLDTVDDLEEADAEDIKNFGKFIFVSCWTSAAKESIPMWKMYSDNMEGVRIGLKKNPFKEHTTIIEPNKNEIVTYIDVDARKKQDLFYISPKAYPRLIKVKYTKKEKLIYPHIKTEEQEVIDESSEVAKGVTFHSVKRISRLSKYETDYIGEYKRKCWAFQKEWRYKIFMSPFTYEELAKCKELNNIKEIKYRIENTEFSPTEEKIFLDLEDNFISEIEILLGPRLSDNMIKEITDMVKRFGIKEDQIQRSELKIRKGQDYLEPTKYPCGEEMISFLRSNPDVRKVVWEKMQDNKN